MPTGYSVEDGALVVNLTGLKEFTVDKAANTATFGLGLSVGELYLNMQQAGSAFPAGSCANVGVGGHLLGAHIPSLNISFEKTQKRYLPY